MYAKFVKRHVKTSELVVMKHVDSLRSRIIQKLILISIFELDRKFYAGETAIGAASNV